MARGAREVQQLRADPRSELLVAGKRRRGGESRKLRRLRDLPEDSVSGKDPKVEAVADDLASLILDAKWSRRALPAARSTRSCSRVKGVISCDSAGRRELARPTPRQQYLPSYMPDALQPVVRIRLKTRYRFSIASTANLRQHPHFMSVTKADNKKLSPLRAAFKTFPSIIFLFSFESNRL